MKTIILPGFSQKNKDWVGSLAEFLKKDFEVVALEWEHWKDLKQRNFNFLVEEAKVTDAIAGDKVNVVAKSVGTLVIAKLLPSLNVNKLVLLGVPLTDLAVGDKITYKSLARFPVAHLLVMQNSQDPHGPGEGVSRFLKSINPAISIQIKPADNHEYPYFDEMIRFLT